MSGSIVQSERPVTILGAAKASRNLVNQALQLAPTLVAADGGANTAVAFGLTPSAVIGDFDSIRPATRAALPATRMIRVDDQDTTDFQKCLGRIAAPFLLAPGFTGQRVDHTLAALNALVRHAGPPCLILSETDVILSAPREIAILLDPGTRVSLFPMARLSGRSEGLRWPIDRVAFAPGSGISTSNEATGPVRLSFDGPGMLVVLPRDALRAAIAALLP